MFGFGTATPGAIPSNVRAILVMVVIGAMVLTHALLRKKHMEDVLVAMSPRMRGVLLGLALFAIAVAGGGQRAFIYFQF